MGNTSGIKWNGINDAGTLQSSYEILLRDTKTNNEEKILLPDFFTQVITLGLIPASEGYWTQSGGNLYPTTLTDNVGIGIITPNYKLDVTDDSQAFAPYLQIGIDAGDPYCFIGNREGGDNLSYAEFTVSDFNIVSKALADVMSIQGRAEYITISNAGGEISRFDGATGNVGIGTNSPSAKLHVVGGTIGTENSDQLNGINFAFAGGNGQMVYVGATNTDYNGFEVYDNDNVVTGRDLTTGTLLRLLANDGNANFQERVTFLNNGNVGIGTQTPASLLTVNGDAEVLGSANGVILESPDNTRYRITVANGGTLTVTAV